MRTAPVSGVSAWRGSPAVVRIAGLVLSAGYAAAVIWIYGNQPQSMAEVRGGLASSVGVYRVDPLAFEEGLRAFREDRFVEARAAFERADPAYRDPTTQFYVAYSFYRQGWGRVYSDDELFRAGLRALDRAVAAAPGGEVRVPDPGLQLQTASALRAELEEGLTRDVSDLNPLRVFGERK